MTPLETQALADAAPSLLAVVKALQTFSSTVLTGDPAQVGLRFDAAFKVLAGTIELQFPTLAQAEIGAVNTDVQAKLTSWANSLTALSSATK
jgi:hypothetical protein